MALRVSNTLDFNSIGAPSSGPSLTWNLTAFGDWQDCPFIDIAKGARGFDNSSETADEQGRITGLVGTDLTVLFVVSSAGDNGGDYCTYRNGVYEVRWEGSGVIQSDNLTTVNSQSAGLASVSITFSGVARFEFSGVDSADPPRNVQVIRSSDVAAYDNGAIFRPEFISMLRGQTYGLRFMGAMSMNGSTVADWADYPVEAWQTWREWPVSVMVALCNELGVHGWFCIPHLATDAFVLAFGTALHTGLDSGLFADVELSNEVWNFAPGFSQSDYFDAQALAGWGVEFRGRDWAGKRYVECMDILEGISPTRFRGIIAGQAANPSRGIAILDAAEWQAQDPANYVAPHSHPLTKFYSIADYFCYPDDMDADFMPFFDANWETDLDACKETFWEFTKTLTAETKVYLDNAIALCSEVDTTTGTSRNLRFRTYEGGSNHMQPGGKADAAWWLSPNVMRPEFIEFCEEVMYDAEIAQRAIELWEYAKALGAESPAAFDFHGRFGKSGSWGKAINFIDIGPTKTREIPSVYAAWSRKGKWWTD